MSTRTKSTALYATPFSRAYWLDAAAELKDVKMLVIAALMIALRVALKSVSIPLAPNLRINVAAPLINAMGAMIFGPVVAGLAACVSDTLGYILFPQGAYFFPCMFVEVAGSMLFAMYFYRAKMTATRVILARFSMDLLVNICLNTAVMFWYYKALMGKSYAAMVLPAVIKNLCMFPIEAFMLALFLAVVIPITRRMGLTYDESADADSLKFSTKQFTLLIALFAVGVACVVGYLFYHYNNQSLSASYSISERYEANTKMNEAVQANAQGVDDTTVTIVESAYRHFGKGTTTYNVTIYDLHEDQLAAYEVDSKAVSKFKFSDVTSDAGKLQALNTMSKSYAATASQSGVMDTVGTASILVNNKTGQVLEFNMG